MTVFGVSAADIIRKYVRRLIEITRNAAFEYEYEYEFEYESINKRQESVNGLPFFSLEACDVLLCVQMLQTLLPWPPKGQH